MTLFLIKIQDELIYTLKYQQKSNKFESYYYFLQLYCEPDSLKMICSSSVVRNAVINQILAFRQRNYSFTRENLYVSISVVDIFLKNHFIQDTDTKAQIMVGIATIWIVSKFNDVHHLKIKHLIQEFNSFEITQEELIQQQRKILQALDFTIPFQNAYQTLANQICSHKNIKNDEKNLKCLKMLLILTKKFEGIILDVQLGKQIYTFVTKKTSTNRFRMLIKKMKNGTNIQSKANQDCPTSQQ